MTSPGRWPSYQRRKASRSRPGDAHEVSLSILVWRLAHAGEPGVGVGGPGRVVAAHLGMGQHQEAVVGEGGDPGVGHLLGRQRLVARQEVLEWTSLLEHPGLHPLRADRLHGHAALAVGDREPLGEADGGMLGDRVRRRPDHREQPGRRGGDHEPAAGAVGQPAWHQQPCGADVGHHVDVDHRRPVVVRGLQAVGLGAVDAGVGHEDVDPAERLGGAVDEGAHALVGRAVAGSGGGADLGSDLLGRGGVEVVDHDPCALRHEPRRERPADAVAGAGHDGALALERGHHSLTPRVMPPSTTRV